MYGYFFYIPKDLSAGTNIVTVEDAADFTMGITAAVITILHQISHQPPSAVCRTACCFHPNRRRYNGW